MTHPRPIPDQARLRALAAQAQLWLVDCLAWLLEIFRHGPIAAAIRAEALRDLHKVRRGVAGIVALLALQQLPARLGTPRAQRPANAPRGFRRSGGCTPFRGAMRLIKLGRGLRGRIAALSRILDNLDAWIARMTKRLDEVGFVAAFVMTAAPVDALVSRARPGPAIADSS